VRKLKVSRDRIKADPNSPFHARSEAVKAALSTPPASQSSATTTTPSAQATEDALRKLDELETVLGGASPAIAAIRKAIETEQRKALAAAKQKETLLAIKDGEIERLKAEVECVAPLALRRASVTDLSSLKVQLGR
jgi:hypothetical protein